MILLNKGQEEAAEKMLAFLEGNLDIPYFTLTGGPGTGKTFLLQEVLRRSGISYSTITAAAVAHAAKNVLNDHLPITVDCFTVAQWLGLKMNYEDDGDIVFKQDKFAAKKLTGYKVAILDEASMIDDYLYNLILKIVNEYNIKLIVVGDVYQLPPVSQEHDSKFFDNITVRLTETMRFKGPITTLANVYKESISYINDGYIGNKYVLNEATSRAGEWNESIDSGYKFENNVYEVVEQLADGIRNHPDDLNYARALAYKNNTVSLLNSSIRDYIYGKNPSQFEPGELVISSGGFSVENRPVLHNGTVLRIKAVKEITGPREIPCLSLKFKDFNPPEDVIIPVVQNTPYAMRKYGKIKKQLADNALRDPRQWNYYYKFIEQFAYFDYSYSLNTYRVQGQTLKDVYVFEGEIMGVKPLTLKQKYQALYVAMTRATRAVYIYNKDN